MADELRPDIDSINRPHWEGLAQGELRFQQCACGHRWLPARAQCPCCLGDSWQWVAAAGGGRILSWVVYHHAYHPAFKERVPYNVALVELDEGPRLMTNIRGPNEALAPDRRVKLSIDTTAAVPIAQFDFA